MGKSYQDIARFNGFFINKLLKLIGEGNKEREAIIQEFSEIILKRVCYFMVQPEHSRWWRQSTVPK